MKKNDEDFKKILKQNINTHESLYNLKDEIFNIINLFSGSLKKGSTIFVCGNGGSASDSEHLSTEFLVRLRPDKNRKPYKIINLGMNLSYMSACSNDFSFENVFSRSLEALAKPGDILWAISTSGNSKNIKKALILAKKLNVRTVGFYGKTGGDSKRLTEFPLLVPSSITARIQECHIFLGHYILEKTEDFLIKNKK